MQCREWAAVWGGAQQAYRPWVARLSLEPRRDARMERVLSDEDDLIRPQRKGGGSRGVKICFQADAPPRNIFHHDEARYSKYLIISGHIQ